MNRSILTAAIVSSLVLTACGGGGGGGNVKSNPPPAEPTQPTNPTPPTTPTNPTPPTTPTPPVVEPSRYTGIQDNLLVPANFDKLHGRNVKGQNTKVAVLDDKLATSYESLSGRITENVDFTATPGSDEPITNDKRGHGTLVASLVGGTAVGDFKGGAAPLTKIYYGRVCADNSCSSLDVREAIADFSADGVKVFNLSLGGYKETELDRINSASAWAYALDQLDIDNRLAIISTGNDGKQEAGYPAATPVYQAHLKDNIVAVAAVELDSTGKVTGLASYSNWCGSAANWCLVTPGLYDLPALADTKFQNGGMGTSFAAAGVTGAAALVTQAFPWMTGSNIQTTLLTTAVDLGDAGVDAKYGWGLLDAESAVQGPKRFDTVFKADVTDPWSISTFRNKIEGAGSLVKSGPGQLNIGADTSYTGGTVIKDGTLGLYATLGGDVRNEAGTLDVYRGKIGGMYTAEDAATTQVRIGVPLEIGGPAMIDGKLKLAPAATDYTVGTTETILKASIVAGQFDSVSYANDFFYTAVLKYNVNSVQADLSRTSVASAASAAGASVQAIEGGKQIDSLVAVLDQRVINGDTGNLGGILSATGSLMSADNVSVAASLPTLTGAIHGVERTLGVQSAINDARVAADRLPYLADTFAPTAWMEGQYIDGSLNRNGYAAADYTQDGLTFGVDLPVGSADTVIGGALTAGRTRADIREENAHLDADRISATGYVYQPIGDGYLSGVVSYSDYSVDSRRTILFGLNGETLTNDRDESAWTARIEGGYKFGNGVTPFGALGAVFHKQGAFSETSASGLGLSANEDTVSATFADIGLRHRTTSAGWVFDSEVAYRNVFDGRNTDFNAWFTGLNDAVFTVAGAPIAQNSFRASFGIGYTVAPNVVVYGNLGAEKVGSDDNNASANVGLRWKF